MRIGLVGGTSEAAELASALRRAFGRSGAVVPIPAHGAHPSSLDAAVVDLRSAPVAAILELRGHDPRLPILALVPPSDASLALEAVRAGASHYVPADGAPADVRRGIERAIERTDHESDTHALGTLASPLVGVSNGIASIRAQIRLVASVDAATVLVTGESGAGKDVVATEIHAAGRRRDRPFMAIDCASIPEPLLESHLFGHERGAFTDAKQLKRGLFELAHGGTIFLDEIGELPLGTQAKLLRALESRRFRRVGGAQDLPLDAAVIAATNRDLLTESREGRFRADLYYRLNVVRIHVPPLRERPQDIPGLVAHFVTRFDERLGRAYRGADRFALLALQDYAWPGNVRELRNVIERAMILNPNEELIRICDLPPEVVEPLLPTAAEGHRSASEAELADPSLATEPSEGTAPLDDDTEAEAPLHVLPEEGVDIVALERALVEAAMRRADGNQTRAAALLGLSRFAMKTRLERHGLQHLAHRRRGRPSRHTGGPRS